MRRVVTLVVVTLALVGATSPTAEAVPDDTYETELILVTDPTCCSCMCGGK